MTIAMHDIFRINNSISFIFGYVRFDFMSGSLKYELSVGTAIYDNVSRRGTADSIRAIPDGVAPSVENIKS